MQYGAPKFAKRHCMDVAVGKMCKYVILMHVIIGPKFYHKNLYATYLLYGLPKIAKGHCFDVTVGKMCNFIFQMAQGMDMCGIHRCCPVL